MKIVDMELTRLYPYENNPRVNDEAVEPVANSIKEFGFKVPIVATQDGEIINGHTRYKAALKLDLSSVPVIIADDLSDEQVKAFRLADNKISELADWDMDKLMSELEGLSDIDDIDMSGFGFDDIQIEEAGLDEPEDDDYDVIPVEDPVSKLGQIWQLGNHRLMVGDSTDSDQVAKLLDGNELDLLVTDPPYNVAYTGATEEALTIENDSMSSEEFLEFLSSAFSAVNPIMKAGATFYVWYASREHINFEKDE